MDYENFKEQIVEEVKSGLYEQMENGGDFFILPSSIAIVAVTMSGYSTQVCAMTSENEGIDLCMEKISSYGADLSISSSGKASIYGSVKAKSGSTYVKVTLQQLSGKTWSSVKSWESSRTV